MKNKNIRKLTRIGKRSIGVTLPIITHPNIECRGDAKFSKSKEY